MPALCPPNPAEASTLSSGLQYGTHHSHLGFLMRNRVGESSFIARLTSEESNYCTRRQKESKGDRSVYCMRKKREKD